MSIRKTAEPAVVAELRRIKTLPLSVKAIVYGGNLGGPDAAVQFNRDLRLYGLWEALLYVEGYEEDGVYTKGTAQSALWAITSALPLRRLVKQFLAGAITREQLSEQATDMPRIWDNEIDAMIDEVRNER